MITLWHFLAVGGVLFALGLVGFLTRRNLLLQLMSIEIMLNSVNLLLVSFNRYRPEGHQGQMMAFFVIAIAAAEAAVGLAILIGLFKLKKSVESDRADLLKH